MQSKPVATEKHHSAGPFEGTPPRHPSWSLQAVNKYLSMPPVPHHPSNQYENQDGESAKMQISTAYFRHPSLWKQCVGEKDEHAIARAWNQHQVESNDAFLEVVVEGLAGEGQERHL